MARIRSIKPAFFTSEDSCRCSPLARLLFLGLLTEADKAGLVEDRPWQLKIRLLPNDDCDVDDLLWQLTDRRLVRRYDANGRHIIQIVNFAKHQKPHPKESASVLPTSGIDRTRPGNSTAEPEKASSLPVEHPSCPRRNGSGDLNNGSGDLGEREPGNAALSRPRVQGAGAFEPGSLPRDHLRHALCGPSMRICLLTWQFDALAKAYNAPDNPHGTRAVIAQFIEQLESGLTPASSIGAFSWIEKEFQTYLKSIGRIPPKITAVKPDLTDVLRDAAREADAKAGRR